MAGTAKTMNWVNCAEGSPFVAFGIKGMKQAVLYMSLGLMSQMASGQEIRFASTPQRAAHEYASQIPQLYAHCTDSVAVDTVYGTSPFHPEPVMIVQRQPLARYEFYLDGTLFRRIGIAHSVSRQDTSWTEDLGTGDMTFVVHVVRAGTPNGAYHEFFRNGNVRIQGTLDGYNPDGTLKKTGVWTEWDENGKVVRRETYP